MESFLRSRVCIWEHLVRHLELTAFSHTANFLSYSPSFSIGCSARCDAIACWFLSPIYSAFLILLFRFDLSTCQLFIFPSSLLSHHLLVCIFTAFLTFFFFHYSMSFSHHRLSGKPRSQTSRDFHGNCKQVSPTLCRHELVLVLQLWKSTDCNLVKQSSQQARIYCTAYHHMFSCDTLLNPNTIPWRLLLIQVINKQTHLFLWETTKEFTAVKCMLQVGS